jgi:hypothetical protein
MEVAHSDGPTLRVFWTPRRGVRPYASVSWRPSRRHHAAGAGLLLARTRRIAPNRNRSVEAAALSSNSCS